MQERIERIRDYAILGGAAVAVVGAMALGLYSTGWIQESQAKKPAMIPPTEQYTQPFERTPAEQAKADAREAINRQAREEAIVEIATD